jgi:hypothetical protein
LGINMVGAVTEGMLMWWARWIALQQILISSNINILGKLANIRY